MHNIKKHILGYINSSVSMGWRRDRGSTSFQNRMNGVYGGGENFNKFTINSKQKKDIGKNLTIIS